MRLGRTTSLLKDYHDNEWGIPKYDDQELFEMLCLESAQAGLSWLTILKKRENYRKAFDDFDIQKVAQYDAMIFKVFYRIPELLEISLKSMHLLKMLNVCKSFNRKVEVLLIIFGLT